MVHQPPAIRERHAEGRGGPAAIYRYTYVLSYFFFSAPGQAVLSGFVLSPPRCVSSVCMAQRVQCSHGSFDFDRILPIHALAVSASEFVHKKKSQRINTCMHLGDSNVRT